jgi:hypothetical protein
MAASLGIYSITVSSLPGGFHQFYYLSRQLDLVQKPPLQIAIKGADQAEEVCCLLALIYGVSVFLLVVISCKRRNSLSLPSSKT